MRLLHGLGVRVLGVVFQETFMTKHQSLLRTIAFFGGGGCAVALFITVGLSARQQQNADTILPPNTWLPMTYEYTVTFNNNVQRYVEYRSSQGDLRRDSLDANEIQIMNVARQSFFIGHAGQWTEHPIRPQPGGGKPYLRLKRSAVTQVQTS